MLALLNDAVLARAALNNPTPEPQMIVPVLAEYRHLAVSLPQIEVLTSDDDRQDIFRLRRDAYVDAGFLPPSSPPAFWDRFDGEPTTLTLAARFNGTRIGGLRFSISLPATTQQHCPPARCPRCEGRGLPRLGHLLSSQGSHWRKACRCFHVPAFRPRLSVLVF